MSNEEIKNEDLKEALDSTEAELNEEAVSTEMEEEIVEKTPLDVAEEEIARLEHELMVSKDTLLRKAAELENVRKRVQRERVALYEEAKVAALQDFLPISEDIFRVLTATEDYDVDENFKSGVKLVADKFEEVFGKYGVEVINATGIPFDVDLHDALLRQPSPDKKMASDTVLQVLENGYKIGNKVIKHAKVIVSE